MLTEQFEYPALMRFFEEISAIPRGSGNEDGVVAYLVEFAKARGLEYYTDSAKNVLIRKAAGKGYENAAPILLQGHTDMVCEKNEGVRHDFLKDPLDLYVENGWLRARGTTLGADDGVAVAAMLAILDGDSEEHPKLECLFTSCEETGMDGAIGFDYSLLKSRMMINMDGCAEHVILAGCAGGARSEILLPASAEANANPCLELRIGGLAGGHSGEDIHRGRANAIKLMGTLLQILLFDCGELRIDSFHGGDKDNAIPRECRARICVADGEKVREVAKDWEEQIRASLCPEDGGFFLTVTEGEASAEVMSQSATARLILLLTSLPNGVFAKVKGLDDMVSFSRNLGAVHADSTGASFIFLSRADSDAMLERSRRELAAYASVFGGECRHFRGFMGWEYTAVSEIRRKYGEAYRTLFGKTLRVETIHAGLECGFVKHKVPDMDIICVGATVLDLHSPDEALDLASFARFFKTLLLTLKS